MVADLTLEKLHLGDSINTATRPQHTKLNKSILLRLPLSVPPRACNPTAYLTGLLHIAPIYIAFESAWDKILASHDLALDSSPSSSLLLDDTSTPKTLPLFPFGTSDPLDPSSPQGKCERVHAILRYLKIEGLARSGSLKRDIRAMSGWSEEELEEELDKVREMGRLGEFVRNVYRQVEKQPEVVVAYAWVLYMALFSGGRFLGSCLEAAGEGFWGKRCDAVLGKECRLPVSVRELLRQDREAGKGIKDDGLPLTFFRFATPLDGEEIKTKFKTRLLELESLLTGEEREHVVREGVCIFDVMNGIVGQLDGVFGGHDEGMDGNGGGGISPSGSLDGWASMLVPRVGLVGGRLRDSVAVAKERGMRALRKATFSAGGGSSSSSLVGEGGDHSYGGARQQRRRSEGSLLESIYTSSSPSAAETSTSGLHAHGTLTSLTELVEKTSLGRAGRPPVLETDLATASKVVRFGEENAVIQLQRKGAKSVTVKTEPVEEEGWGDREMKGECPVTKGRQQQAVAKVRQQGVARVTREEAVKDNLSTFWSLVLLVALVGFGWGYGYGYITGR
ncbi:hypothetical protein B0T21DRAFT_384322 [Apiosordaria backusii]|uniref:Heme oxygenase n=1 Tax=Apiosordaria backusii TaxID=314023 RepID=A0AA40BJQ7_9PEZI|nr:hypothetical protein B0T21DRAFT_384322 [Apiosordaria backusii]